MPACRSQSTAGGRQRPYRNTALRDGAAAPVSAVICSQSRASARLKRLETRSRFIRGQPSPDTRPVFDPGAFSNRGGPRYGNAVVSFLGSVADAVLVHMDSSPWVQGK